MKNSLRKLDEKVRKQTFAFKALSITLLTSASLIACGGGSNTQAEISADQLADQKADALVAKMTQAEKIQLVHGAGFPAFAGGVGAGRVAGIPRLGIPDIRYVDTASGVGIDGVNATALPSNLGIASSWDTQLMAEYSTLIAKEARTLGFAGALGGGLNLARELRNGRTFEYLGEDPVLAGELMVARTDATQAQNVISTLKHFAGNEQETNRFTSNSVIDERTLRELYLQGFEMAIVRSQPGNVTCAYNLLNNEKSCQNKTLLTNILKGDWGFKGVVQSDWFVGITDTVAAANAGLDEEEPGSADECTSLPSFLPCASYFANKLLQAISTDKTVSQSRLDDMVHRKLRTLYRIGLMDTPPPATAGSIDVASGDTVALNAAQRSMVLLKNAVPVGDTSNALPLRASVIKNIVVIGGHADVAVMGGGGSGHAPHRDDNSVPAVACLTPGATDPVIHNFSLCAAWHKSSPLQALRANMPGATITYLDGTNIAAAQAAAAAADVALVFGTQYTVESMDLSSLALPDNAADPANQSYDQNALIAAVASAAKRTVVVLETGTAVTMPWLANVHAVLEAWYPGVQGGAAIANALTGAINPSGKLPITFPVTEADLPQKVISQTDPNVIYSEGLKMGYRWFDAKGIVPLFPFGHGLSYTSFSYSGLNATRASSGEVTLRFTLKNTGSVAGTEIAQVYATLPPIAGVPPQRLVGFKPVALNAGASTQVALTLPPSRFAIWDQGWTVPAGTASISVGGSSRDTNSAKTSLTLESMRVDHAR